MVAESPTESTAGAVISDAARAAVATVSALPHVPAIAWVLAARLAAAAYAGYVLSYIILFGFQHAGHEVASFVLAWLGSEALSLLLIDPAAHVRRRQGRQLTCPHLRAVPLPLFACSSSGLSGHSLPFRRSSAGSRESACRYSSRTCRWVVEHC